MAKSFLTNIPLEIRDLIYTYALASPSGLVNLTPWSLDVARSLALLRTCHQVHRECKNIIWKHNGFSLGQRTQLSEKLAWSQCMANVASLELCLEVLDWDELDWFMKSAGPLRTWLNKGSLRVIKLSTSWEKPASPEEFKEVLALRKYGERVDGRLVRATVTAQEMVVNTSWPRLTHWGKQRWLREMLLDATGLDAKLEDIHALFGGELYLNNVLCFVGGTRPAYNSGVGLLDPRDGVILIRPARSIGRSVLPVIRSKCRSRASGAFLSLA